MRKSETVIYVRLRASRLLIIPPRSGFDTLELDTGLNYLTIREATFARGKKIDKKCIIESYGIERVMTFIL